MKIIDHKILAFYWIDKVNRKKRITYACKQAFLIGSIEPDWNILTYLHGIVYGEKFHGHNYDNILPIMRKLFKKLNKRRKMGIREYYILGKLMHYTADSFTFPHNKEFKGTLSEHCEYERKLHRSMQGTLKKTEDSIWKQHINNSFKEIEQLHNLYIDDTRSYETDCRYIIKATGSILMTKA